MVFLLDDTFKKEYGIYQSFEKKVPISEHQKFKLKNMKPTTHLLLNQQISSLHRQPILHSDKKQHGIDIRPYSRFKGENILPHYKEDLKSWKVI